MQPMLPTQRIATFASAENVQAIVTRMPSGKYSVTVWDLDAEMMYPTVWQFDTESAAVDKAKEVI